MNLRRYLQRVLRVFGYQLVRNTQPPALKGKSHAEEWSIPETWRKRLRADNPRLIELKERYQHCDSPMGLHSWWNDDYVSDTVELLNFRGDNAYVWQTRHLPDAIRQRYFLYALDVSSRDELKLFEQLQEDGAFGCFVFPFSRFPKLSRDLLDSVNEINFLQRHANLAALAELNILDIGAGYGRLAHRCLDAFPNISNYYCVDAVPESTFLCESYLEFRDCTSNARVIALDKIDQLRNSQADVAINVHSFSEMRLSAIEGWLQLLIDMQIPRLFVIPNDGESFLSMEQDGTRQDFLSLILDRGYQIIAQQPVIEDPDTRRLVGVGDQMFLFENRKFCAN